MLLATAEGSLGEDRARIERVVMKPVHSSGKVNGRLNKGMAAEIQMIDLTVISETKSLSSGHRFHV